MRSRSPCTSQPSTGSRCPRSAPRSATRRRPTVAPNGGWLRVQLVRSDRWCGHSRRAARRVPRCRPPRRAHRDRDAHPRTRPKRPRPCGSVPLVAKRPRRPRVRGDHFRDRRRPCSGKIREMRPTMPPVRRRIPSIRRESPTKPTTPSAGGYGWCRPPAGDAAEPPAVTPAGLGRASVTAQLEQLAGPAQHVSVNHVGLLLADNAPRAGPNPGSLPAPIEQPARSAAMAMPSHVIDVGSHTTVDPANSASRAVSRSNPPIDDDTPNCSTSPPEPI